MTKCKHCNLQIKRRDLLDHLRACSKSEAQRPPQPALANNQSHVEQQQIKRPYTDLTEVVQQVQESYREPIPRIRPPKASGPLVGYRWAKYLVYFDHEVNQQLLQYEDQKLIAPAHARLTEQIREVYGTTTEELPPITK